MGALNRMHCHPAPSQAGRAGASPHAANTLRTSVRLYSAMAKTARLWQARIAQIRRRQQPGEGPAKQKAMSDTQRSLPAP
jgi:hypothetical protein